MSNLLIVDDNEQNVQQMQHFIHAMGHKCQFTLTSEFVFDILENECVDLMLLDVHLPKTNGLQLLQQIKSIPDYKNLSVVMITADESDQLLADCLNAGAVDFIHKPFRDIAFKARVQSVLCAGEYQHRLMLEIIEHKRTTATLRASRQRLTRILDTLDEGVLALNEEQKLVYLNQTANCIFQAFPKSALHGSLYEIIPELKPLLLNASSSQSPQSLNNAQMTLRVSIPQKSDTPFCCQAAVTQIELPQEIGWMVRLIPEESSEDASRNRYGFSERKSSDATQKNQMQQLEWLLSGMWKLLKDEGWPQLQLLNILPADMDELQEELPTVDRQVELRSALVETLQLALRIWEQTTGKTYEELAEESGLWSVYHDPDGGCYARTLSKYLSLDRLPNHPRWRKVLQTSYFVLQQTSTDSELYLRLSAQIDHLECLLRQSSF